MTALEAETAARVADGYAERLRRDAPGACEGMSEGMLREKIEAAIAEGRGQGLTSDEGLYQYALVAALAGWTSTVALDRTVSDLARRVALAVDRTAERIEIDAFNAGGAAADQRATVLRTAGAAARIDRQGAIVACPLARRWKAIEIEVVGEDDLGLADVAIEIRRGGDGLYDVTDSAGRCRFEGLDDGRYMLNLHGVDADAWELTATAPLPPEGAETTGPVSWDSLREPPPPPSPHAVEPGECVSSIAFDFGLLPETLWHYGPNAGLRESRINRNILFTNDEIHIPPSRRRNLGVATSNRYRVRRRGVPEHIRIRFRDRDDRPMAGAPYLLKITTRAGVVVRNRKGATDGDGYVTEPIPPDADRGEVVLGTVPEVQRYPFLIGRVGPIDTIEGLQSRLQNLGYFAGEQDGQASESLSGAIGAFQIEHGLEVTGVADAATRAKLVDVHRS